jgi:glycosyltransferase involved in cell wall biosynthesis
LRVNLTEKDAAAVDMKENKIRIGIVFASDFHGNPPGGGQPTIEIFLKYAQERPFDIWLFGLTTSREEPVGKLSKRRIYGRDYPFVPLFHFDAERYRNKRPLVPLRIRALLGYIRRRHIVDSMNFDLVYLHAPEALPFLWPKRQPVLYHIHGTQESAAEYSRYPIFKTRAFAYPYRAWVDSILRRSDEFIAIDQESYDLYTQRMPERERRFHLFPTAIDVDQFRPISGFDRREMRHRFGLPPEGKMVLYVGRLSWKKGLELVVRAFSLVAAQLADSYLAIAGDGEDRAGLEALVHELGLAERVFFLGHVPHLPARDLPHVFNSADVSVVASFHESLALVITESLACGVPVVSTAVGIAPKVIHDGVTGYLVRSREPAEMAGRIIEIIRDGYCDRGKCVIAARDYAETSKSICEVISGMKEAGDREKRILSAEQTHAS